MHGYLLIVWVCLAFHIVENRVYQQTISLQTFRKESGWVFMDRMSAHPGTMQIITQIKIKASDFKMNSQFQLEVRAVPSQFWLAQSQKKCDLTKYSSTQLNQKASKQIVQTIRLNRQNEFELKSNLTREIANETYFSFVLRDCNQTVLRQGLGKGATINIKLNIITNGQHRSPTQAIYSWILPLTISVCLATIFWLGKSKDEEENWIKYILKISLWFAFSATLFKYLGYLIYAHLNGEQYQFFDFMYLLLYSTSDSILIVLLIILSFGWTVTFKSTVDFDIYVPLTSMLGMINIIMTCLNKVTDGSYDKFHVFDSIPAYIMVFFRLIGFAAFVAGIIVSFIKLKNGDDSKKKRIYFVYLAILGTLYLTFIPGSLLLVNLFESHERKQIMFLFVQIGKYFLSIWLGFLSNSQKSIYRNIIDQSFMEKGEKYY